MSLGGIGADDVEDGVGVRVLHRRPAIGGRIGLMDHQEADGAPARGFLVLVGPAAVIGHGLAAEVALAGLEVGVIDQHQADLPLHVDALEVVPVPLGRGHAIAKEDDGRVLHGQAADPRLGCADGNLLALGPGLGLSGGSDAHGDRALGVEPGQGHVLGPGPGPVLLQVAARLEAEACELLDQVGHGLALALGVGAPALEGVGGEGLDVPGQPGRVQVGGPGGRRQGGGGQEQGRQAGQEGALEGHWGPGEERLDL